MFFKLQEKRLKEEVLLVLCQQDVDVAKLHVRVHGLWSGTGL